MRGCTSYDRAFRTACNSAHEVVLRGMFGRSRDHERVRILDSRFIPFDRVLECCHVGGRHSGVGAREERLNDEEPLLHLVEHARLVRSHSASTNESDHGVQLIDRPQRFIDGMILRKSLFRAEES